jgi:hypothetical protein
VTDTRPRYEPDETFVPADRRWLGLDRRTIAPTLVVFALAFVMTVVLPIIDVAVSYDDKVVPGDVLALDGDVTFVPEPGWGITSGVRIGAALAGGQYPPKATVVDGGVTFTVRSAEFHGDANALLDQIKTTTDALSGERGVRITGERSTVSTESGESGVLTQVAGPRSRGVLAAFVFGDYGVQAVATGPTDDAGSQDEAVRRMIGSIRRDEKSAK